MNIRTKLIKVSIAHFESHIEKHRMNIEVMLANPMAIHDHTDIMSAIELELEKIADYTDKLEAIKHFENNVKY
jgi:hypothetical protein